MLSMLRECLFGKPLTSEQLYDNLLDKYKQFEVSLALPVDKEQSGLMLYTLTKKYLTDYKLSGKHLGLVFQEYIRIWRKHELVLHIEKTEYNNVYIQRNSGQYNEESPMLAGFNLAGMILSPKDQIDIKELYFIAVNLNSACLNQRIFKNIYLESCDLRKMSSIFTTFELCSFINCQFDDAELADAKFYGVCFFLCKFEETKLLEAFLYQCEFVKCNVELLSNQKLKLYFSELKKWGPLEIGYSASPQPILPSLIAYEIFKYTRSFLEENKDSLNARDKGIVLFAYIKWWQANRCALNIKHTEFENLFVKNYFRDHKYYDDESPMMIGFNLQGMKPYFPVGKQYDRRIYAHNQYIGVNFSGADLSYLEFGFALFLNCDLSNINAIGTHFNRVVFFKCEFKGATIITDDLCETTFSNCNLKYATLAAKSTTGFLMCNNGLFLRYCDVEKVYCGTYYYMDGSNKYDLTLTKQCIEKTFNHGF